MNGVSDRDLIEALLHDEVFIASIEESLGKLKSLKADFNRGKIIYEFVNGDYKETSISLVVRKLRKIGYIHSISH